MSDDRSDQSSLHEVRGALAVTADTLAHLADGHTGPIGPALAAALKQVRSQVLGQVRTLGDLRDIGLADAGRLRLRARLVPVGDLLAGIGRVIDDAGGAQSTISTAPGEVFVDPERVTEVVVRQVAPLLGPGGIDLSATDDGAFVRIVAAVPDSGAVAGPGAVPARPEGLGVARRIVELHGGTLSWPTPSRLEVTLPRSAAHIDASVLDRRSRDKPAVDPRRRDDRGLGEWARDLEEQPDYRFYELGERAARADRGIRVLLVDDDPEVRRLVCGGLGEDFSVESADGSAQALEQARARPPHVVVTDFVMPGDDGLALARLLRADPVLGNTPVLVLAEGTAIDSGLDLPDGFLAKPFDLDELRHAIREVLAIRGRDALKLLEAGERRLEIVSGGLAHELYNPLSVIRNGFLVVERSVEQIQSSLPDPPSPEAALASDRIGRVAPAVHRGVDRIEQLVDQMRTYARMGYPTELEVVALDPLVVQVTDRLACSALHRDLGATDAGTRVVPDELDQVVGNLIRNALGAAGPDGRVDLRTRADARWVVLEVADDGPGIAPELQDRVFHPFFTTRKAGEGLGMGLAITRQVVERAGGSISLASTPGEGATFRVRLPRARG